MKICPSGDLVVFLWHLYGQTNVLRALRGEAAGRTRVKFKTFPNHIRHGGALGFK